MKQIQNKNNAERMKIGKTASIFGENNNFRLHEIFFFDFFCVA